MDKPGNDASAGRWPPIVTKDEHRLEELAGRWRCTVSDLLHLGIQNSLQICADLTSLGGRELQHVVLYALQDSDEGGSSDDERKAIAPPGLPSPPQRMRAGLFEILNHHLRDIDSSDAGSCSLTHALRSTGNEWIETTFKSPVVVAARHLRVLDREVRRFEKEHPTRVGQAYSESAGRSAGPWPWGSYETELLRHLEAAARKFWVNFDPSEPTTAPHATDIEAWLQERKLSRRMAAAITTLLRSDDLPEGRRPGEREPI